ncbi:hypothetical protein B296_00029153 [Ensete ventricosum]|uniref:Uncharacterized protein n=1 Tax=Ensete ventricosum TaxID=4639 RepID=A0A426YT90_ENSVE|nr:hypothetical protein B296_00029153 [Ensete ventricosum]
MVATTAEEATDEDVVGGENFKCVYQWRKKLQSYPSTMEGVMHGSNGNRGNCARKLHHRDLRTTRRWQRKCRPRFYLPVHTGVLTYYRYRYGTDIRRYA